MRAGALGAIVLGLLVSLPRTAEARPQANAAWATGLCGSGERAELWQESSWCNGLRADVLFGRDRGSDFALGPYAQIHTAGFWDARFGGGLSLLAPLSHDFPLVFSLGAGSHELEAVALESWLFFGPRAYNFHSDYAMAGGLLLGFSRDLDERGRSEFFAGVSLDGLVLALPFVLGYQWLRGDPD